MSDHQLDTLIRAYAEAKAAKDAAEKEYEALRKHLMIAMDEEGLKNYTGSFAVVTVCERKSYAYPDAIIRAEELLKAEKEAAERTGNATIRRVTRYPKVTMTE
jgi:hypothetical protein